MAQFIYAFVFAGIMSANAVTTSNIVLSVVDWVACAWLFVSGVILTINYFNQGDTLEVNFYDED